MDILIDDSSSSITECQAKKYNSEVKVANKEQHK